MRSSLVLVIVSAIACGGAPARPAPPPAAEKILVNLDDAGVALHGHDAVSYVADGAVVAGSNAFSSTRDGAIYWFATAAHKATFDADPAHFEPRFGGFCAFAASQNRLSDVEPDQWKLQDGHLLLFTNAAFHEQFDKDPRGNLAAADRNWPGLVALHGKPR
jgi:YHS domain-containing protein